MPDIDAIQGGDRPVRGGDVLSHVPAALVGRPEVHTPSGESWVAPWIDKPIPVHEHEQGSVDMQHVRGAKEVSPADFPPSPQVLREH